MRTFGKDFYVADITKMARKKLINKQDYKHTAGECRICKDPCYEILDVHRLKPGAEGGEYVLGNVVAICANCHRKTHEGKIVIDRWYPSTAGNLLRVIIDGEEKWL